MVIYQNPPVTILRVAPGLGFGAGGHAYFLPSYALAAVELIAITPSAPKREVYFS